MGNRAEHLKLVLAFAAVYIIWGSTYLAIRIAIETMPPLAMAGSRFLIAGLLFVGIAAFLGAPMPKRREWRDAFIVGTLMLAGATGTITWAEQWVPSGVTALLVATMPMWIVLIDWLRPRGLRPGWPVVLGLLVGFFGVALLLDPELGPGMDYLIGAVSVVLAGFLWALGSILSRHTAHPQSEFMATGLKMLLGGLSLTVGATIAGEWSRVEPSAITWTSLAAWAYLITFGSVAYAAYIWLLKASTPEKAATYAYVNPAVAVILGTLLAGEPFTAKSLAASVIIVVAVVIIISYRRKVSPAPIHVVHPPSTRNAAVRGSDIEAA